MEVIAESTGLLTRGGPVMLVLLLASVVAVVIILVKLYHFWRAGLGHTEFVSLVMQDLQRGERERALHALGIRFHPVARVMETAILLGDDRELSSEDREAEIDRVGTAEVRNLESYLRGLEVIANLSPLLGLLGTVLGMINAFSELEAAGSKVDPAILAGGIWEALLTTAFGLVVAIPALAAYYMFEGRIDTVRAAMKDTVVRVLGVTGRAGRLAVA